jgi:UDP-3-O-[3-hydroxymyristoyl] glucosamine N-acyltransferase
VAVPAKTLAELATFVGGKVVGNGDLTIHRVAPIDEAKSGEITFLSNTRYAKYLESCRASAVIVGTGTATEYLERSPFSFLETPDPYVAFAKILQLFSPSVLLEQTCSPQANVDASAILEEGVTVFPHVYVGARAKIGRNSALYPGVFIGDDCSVGSDCVLHPNVVVRHGCCIGSRVILHAGVVIGSDGFGYAGQGESRVKIPQVGIVVVEDDVEIGANTTVDRATLGQTVIHHGAKIDNLVQIAHNVSIGEHSIVAAQAGIAGSTKVGKHVTIAGQAGIVNHVEIGDGATIGPQSGIPKSVPAGVFLSGGIAAAPHHEWLKVMTLLPQLPKLWASVRAIERQLGELLKK